MNDLEFILCDLFENFRKIMQQTENEALSVCHIGFIAANQYHLLQLKVQCSVYGYHEYVYGIYLSVYIPISDTHYLIISDIIRVKG